MLCLQAKFEITAFDTKFLDSTGIPFRAEYLTKQRKFYETESEIKGLLYHYYMNIF